MEDFQNCLRKNGLKVTPQRIAVHKAMMSLGHASADMVAAHVHKNNDDVKVTTASVYNILSQLSDLGIYHRRMSANSKMYFDVNTFPHMHLYDTVNNVYIDVVDDEIYKEIESRLLSRRFKGYKIDRVDIQILAHPSVKKRK